MDKIEQTKERILWACSLVNRSSDDAIQILRDCTIANIRSIERNSRSIKDPNPLMSTMTNINTKFPITFKPSALDIDLVPKELYSSTADNRRSGRILCKTDLIQWYIDNVNENTNKESHINKLFESSIKKYNIVFNYNWGDVSFKIGSVSLSRALVPVNPNDIDIPKEFIKPSILQTLNLDNMIEYVDVPEYYMNQVKSILENSNLDTRSLPNILNYIVSQMDKRFRYLPILRGLTPDFIYISHSLLQPQYRATSLLSESSTEKGQNKSITELCINLIHYCKKNTIPYYQLREMVSQFTFYGYPVQKILSSTDENKFTRFVKGCIGLKITPVIEKRAIKFYPKSGKVFETIHRNKAGLLFRRYNGEEMVYFESNTSKGFFVHNADALLTITINRTDLKNLAFVLSQIAVFITKEFETVNAQTMSLMKSKISKKFSEKWWLLVGMTGHHVRSVKREIENGVGDTVMGPLRFSDAIEIELPDKEACIVKDDILIGVSSGQQICTVPFVAEPTVLDFNIKASDPRLYELLNPKRQLIKAIQYNLSSIGIIKADIREGKFSSSFYEKLIKYVPFSSHRNISEHFKSVLQSKVNTPGQNDLFISIFYNFVYGGKPTISTTNIERIMFAKEYIYTNLENGIIRLSQDGSLLCDKELIVSVSKEVREGNEAVCALLPNFTLRKVHRIIKGLKTHSIAWLNKNNEILPEGYTAYTMFQTSIFEVKKTSSMKIQTLNTLKRHITIGMESDTSNEFAKYLLKRKIEETSGSSDADSSSKRRKLDDASSIIS